MSKSKARGWLTIGFGIVYGGLLYGSILAAAHKADPKFSLWKLDKPREYATPNQDAGNKWQAASYHDSQPTYLTVLSQLGAQVSGYQKAQYTDPDRYRENERADRDLRAQEEMADWAFWVMILTGATVAVTCAGVILVGFTLLETKRLRGEAEKTTRAAMAAVTSSDRAADATVRAANSAADANDQARTFFVEQQRARLSVDAAVSKVSWEGENAQFEIAIKVDNTGHSNAENVLPHPLVIVHPLPSLDTIKRIIDERISRVSTFG
jgi:hypothetical protein